MPGPPFISLGEKIDQIPVEISYRIIELFSAGLYSSPNKAIEELVSNSYDAMASTVHLLMPLNLDSPDAAIWVVDNGESMDLAGLVELWRVAKSRKRTEESSERPPIGKFGIGKLATYVLARQLTYICRRGSEYLAVTMDFGRIDPEQDAATKLLLDVRRLTHEEVETALAPMKKLQGGAKVATWLLSTDGPASWTVVAMRSLRSIASQLKHGRLRWILSTALPMSLAFRLYLNAEEVKPSLEEDRAACGLDHRCR